MTVAAKDLLFHLRNGMVTTLKVFCSGQVAKAILISLDLRNTTIPVLKIMQGDKVFGPVDLDMVLDADIIIKLIGFLQNKFPFPFYIEISSFAKCTDSNFCLVVAGKRLQGKHLVFEFYVINLRAFDQFNPILFCNFCKYGVEFIPTDPKSAQRQSLLEFLPIGRCN